MTPHNARQRMLWLLAAFGPPGSQPTTQEHIDALNVITHRIVDSIPIAGELTEAEKAALPIYGALLDDYDFEITPVARERIKRIIGENREALDILERNGD